MNEYYGDMPYSESLAHWGVKGMKWGVRKARPVESGGGPKSFGYRRAERKLARLQAKADRNAILARANRLDKVSKGARVAGRIGLGAATAGTVGSIGAKHLGNKSIKDFHDRLEPYSKMVKSPVIGPGDTADKMVKAYDGTAYKMASEQFDREMAAHKKLQNVSRGVQAGGAGLAALGYGVAIGSKLRANALRRTANDSAKLTAARRKAEAYRQQMSAKYGIAPKRKHRR